MLLPLNNVMAPLGLTRPGATAGTSWPTTGLIYYWKLDETSGARVDSVVGNVGTGLAPVGTGTIGSSAGVIGNAAQLHSTDRQGLSVSNLSMAFSSVDISLFFWFRHDVAADGTSGHYLIWSAASGSAGFVSSTVVTIAVRRGAGPSPILSGVFRMTGGNSSVAPSLISTPAGSMHSCYLEWDHALRKIAISVDDETLAVGNATTNSYFSQSNPPFFIGFSPTDTLYNADDVSVDELGIWGRKLTSLERTYMNGVHAYPG